MEFVSLCQSGARLPGGPDTLFDVLDGWSKKNKNNFWPLQTMLLVLSPDIMLKISLNKDKGPDIIAKVREGRGIHVNQGKVLTRFVSIGEIFRDHKEGIENTKNSGDGCCVLRRYLQGLYFRLQTRCFRPALLSPRNWYNTLLSLLSLSL